MANETGPKKSAATIAALEERAAALAAAIKSVSDGVEDNAAHIDMLTQRLVRTRRNVIWLATSLALDLILTVVVTLIVSHQNTLSEQQRATTEGALCPLYTYLINAYHPELQAPDKVAEYNRGYDVIRNGAKALGCH